MRLQISGEYPANWKEVSAAVQREAGFRCVRCHHAFDPTTRKPLLCLSDCDISRGKHLLFSAPQRIATLSDPRLPGLNYGVHHLDGDKSNCRWWNLLALCNSCHLTIQARVIPERHWLFEHSDWFKPYAAGFYAFWFAQAETLRAGVEADIDYFLAMGQPWLYPDRVRVGVAS